MYTYKKEEKEVRFSYLDVGDFFLFSGGLYMKLTVESPFRILSLGAADEYRSTLSLTIMQPDPIVIPVRAYLKSELVFDVYPQYQTHKIK